MLRQVAGLVLHRACHGQPHSSQQLGGRERRWISIVIYTTNGYNREVALGVRGRHRTPQEWHSAWLAIVYSTKDNCGHGFGLERDEHVRGCHPRHSDSNVTHSTRYISEHPRYLCGVSPKLWTHVGNMQMLGPCRAVARLAVQQYRSPFLLTTCSAVLFSSITAAGRASVVLVGVARVCQGCPAPVSILTSVCSSMDDVTVLLLE
jgi:hypothetical protein